MLNGVDIASHQAGIRIADLTDTDFVIVKTSGGIGYLNPYARDMLNQAINAGKLIGSYHYAREKGCKGSAKDEAAFYVESTNPYIGQAVPCLDWEEECTLGTGWAKEWLDEVYKLTGVKPIVYTSQSVCAYYDWSAVVNAGYKLWLAQYASMDPIYGWQSMPWQSGSLGAWNHERYVMHQYGTGYVTGYSSRIDMDLFYGDASTWKSLAAKSGTQPQTKPQPSGSTVTADDIIGIMFGWEGLSRASQTHREIIDTYNSHKPLTVGYAVSYWDDYCDTTVSAAFIKANAVNLIGGTECGVERHVKLFQNAGIWIEDGSITPQKGDIIVFNWDEDSQPNNGFSDHIGIVYNCEKGIIYTIEGNTGNAGTVAKRAYSVGNGNIRGFARPKYGTASSSAPVVKPVIPTTQPADASKVDINRTPQWTGKITADVLNIRTWAGTENPNLKSYPYLVNGTIVEVCDVVKASDGKDWYYIKITGSKGEKYGFASAAYIGRFTNTTSGQSINPPSKTPKYVGKVNGDTVNVRKGAGVEYANLVSWPVLHYGNLVDICDTVKDVNGDDWFYIRIGGNKFGFIYSEFIDRV